MDGTHALIVLLLIVGGWCLLMKSKLNKANENYTTGFAVTSGLALNNRDAQCYPGNGYSWSGGCFLPHRVII